MVVFEMKAKSIQVSGFISKLPMCSMMLYLGSAVADEI